MHQLRSDAGAAGARVVEARCAPYAPRQGNWCDATMGERGAALERAVLGRAFRRRFAVELSPSFDVFLSYRSRDHARVVALAEALAKRAGLRAFVDRWYLIPGEPWLG